MHKRQRGYIDPIFVVMLILLVVVAGVIFWGVNQADQTVSDTDVATTGSTDQTSQFNPEAPGDRRIPDGWLEYASSSNNFSFFYPPTWEMVSSGSGPDEIVRIFSETPLREVNIYACLDIRASNDVATSVIYSERDLDSGLQIHSDNDEMYLTNNGRNTTLLLADGSSFQVMTGFNCVQNDYSVIENDDTFVVTERPELADLTTILETFEVE